jgi:hypothetical protein
MQSATQEYKEFIAMHNIRVSEDTSKALWRKYKEWAKSLPAGVNPSKTAFLRGIIEDFAKQG